VRNFSEWLLSSIGYLLKGIIFLMVLFAWFVVALVLFRLALWL
jgi:hypothetical protein